MFNSDINTKTAGTSKSQRAPSYSGNRTVHSYVCSSPTKTILFSEFSPPLGTIDITANEIDILKKGTGQLIENHYSATGPYITGDYSLTSNSVILNSSLSISDVIQIKRCALFVSPKSVPYEIPRYRWVIPAINNIDLTSVGSGTSTINGTLNFNPINVDISLNTITITGHGLVNAQAIKFTTTGSLPSGLSLNTEYYAFIINNNKIKISTTKFVQDSFRLVNILQKTKKNEIPAYFLYMDGSKLTQNTQNDSLNTDKVGDYYEIDINSGYVRDFKLNEPFANFDVTPKTLELYMNGFIDYTDTFVQNMWKRTVPPGMIGPYAGGTVPQGWLACDGSAVSRTIYSDLFEAVGTVYGSGDGLSTFNLPNSQGIYLRGIGSQTIGSETYNGGSLGSKSNDTTAVNGLNNNSSSVTGSVGGSDGTHIHSLDDSTVTNGSGTASSAAGTIHEPATTTTTHNTLSTGSGHGHGFSLSASAQSISGDSETKPATLAINYIIKI